MFPTLNNITLLVRSFSHIIMRRRSLIGGWHCNTVTVSSGLVNFHAARCLRDPNFWTKDCSPISPLHCAVFAHEKKNLFYCCSAYLVFFPNVWRFVLPTFTHDALSVGPLPNLVYNLDRCTFTPQTNNTRVHLEVNLIFRRPRVQMSLHELDCIRENAPRFIIADQTLWVTWEGI